jgi:hypothetical protein
MQDILSALEQQAIANRKGDYYMASAAAESKVGKIVCFVDFSWKNKNSRAKHVHVRYDLNGKRIAKAELAARLA